MIEVNLGNQIFLTDEEKENAMVIHMTNFNEFIIGVEGNVVDGLISLNKEDMKQLIKVLERMVL